METVRRLQELVRACEGAARTAWGNTTSGNRALDRLLPGPGLRRGTLVEWLVGNPGGGATTLATVAAREACRPGGWLVVVDRQRRFYPPAAVSLGVDLHKTLLIRPDHQRDQSWALQQALACPGIAAVLCWPGRIDDRTFRCWQLAAEKSGSLGLLVRPAQVQGTPTWSEAQFLVEALPMTRIRAPAGRRVRVQLLRCRHGIEGQCVELEIDEDTGLIHETNTLDLASTVAPATPPKRA